MMKKSLCALVFAVVVLVTISIAGAAEPYRQVNRAELPFIFSGAMKSLEVDAAGNTVNVEGVVAMPYLQFPLIKPYVQFSRIRLSSHLLS